MRPTAYRLAVASEPAIDEHFDCTDFERASFEAGIKLGAAYHQFTGAPVSTRNVDALERAIRETVSTQPYVESVEVRIDREKLGRKAHEFDYCGLRGDMLDLRVVVRYGDARVAAGIAWLEELRYPLMHVKRIEEKP